MRVPNLDTSMMHVGLTGGIGSGKTTVARVFRTLGVPVFEADAEGRKLLENDSAVQAAIAERFGMQLLQSGKVDRKALAAIVFNDPQALAVLNGIIHPAVRAAFAHWAGSQDKPYVIMESAILAESGGHANFQRIIVVSAPEPLRMARVVQRDGVEEHAVQARMANQVSDVERSAIADHVIHNDDRQLVIPQVLAVHEALLSASKS